MDPVLQINCRCPDESPQMRRIAPYDVTIMDDVNSGMWSDVEQGYVDRYNCNEDKIEPLMSRFRNFQ